MGKMFSRFSSVLMSLILIAQLLAFAPTVYGQPVAQGSNIPVIINIYNNSGITEEEARKAVEEASKILGQAGYKLTVVKVNTGVTAGDDGDGDLTSTERERVRNEGQKELDKTPNKKGIKICFVRTPTLETPDNPGVAVHHNPVVIVRNRGTAELTGQTIAHEIGHVLSLSSGHKIDDTTTADEGGHAPDKTGRSGRGNLMAPSDYREGTHLTPDQIKEILKKRYVVGKCSVQWKQVYPALKEKQQYGTKTDDLGDIGLEVFPYFDISSITLWSIDGADSIEGQLSLGGLFSGTVEATYALVFDSDNNDGTGYSYGGFTGIEFVLMLNVTGSGDSYLISGVVRELSTGLTQTLPETPVMETTEELLDLDYNAIPVYDILFFKLPKEYVGIDITLISTVTTIPIGVLSIENGLFIHDNSSLVLNLNQWENDPSLNTHMAVPIPGADYPISICGLKPNSKFSLYVDERLVFVDSLNDSGGFSGSFVFPSDLSNTEMHFLTAQDETGEFAYSITCPAVLLPVGGIVVPAPRTTLLAPYIGLALIIFATTIVVVFKRCLKAFFTKPNF